MDQFRSGQNGWYYREWAPNADQLYLTGDFNGWGPLLRIGWKKTCMEIGSYFYHTKPTKILLYMAAK
jgi:1,4-alpha-glucan branching enzyme